MTAMFERLSHDKRRKLYCVIRYPFEAVGFVFFCALFRLLPLDWASAIGGWLGRKIGPRLKVSWGARYNLMKVFPEKTVAEIDEIVVGMWDNVVRTFAEYPHLRWLSSHYDCGRIEYIGSDLMEQMRDDGKPGIFFSAHIGNWETASVFSCKTGVPFHRIYRGADNPYVEWAFRYFRLKIKGELVGKGVGGFRKIVSAMRKGGHLALLIDQKMNEGIWADFFGFPVKTTPSLAALALKYGCPVLPIRSQRLKGAHYRLTAGPFLTVEKTGDTEKDTLAWMNAANKVLEDWIRDDPTQWFWVHKRFPETKTKWIELYRQRKLWKKGIKPADVFASSQIKHTNDF